jgi:acyl-CoA thioesterase I
MRYVLVLLCLIAASGCRQEVPRRESAPPDAAPPRVDARPAIVAFGDSLTAGFGVDPGQSYPDFLQQELDRRGYRYRVVNQGVSGDTTSDGLARVAMAAAEKPAIVILELGANDGLRGLPLTATRHNLELLATELQKSGAQVVLAGMTLPPNYGPDFIGKFEAVFRDVARQYRLPLIPFLLAGVGGTKEYMQGDGLHATVEGNRRVAATVMKTLDPLLKR